MRIRFSSVRVLTAVTGTMLTTSASLMAQAPVRSANNPPPRFADPDRVAKLTSDGGKLELSRSRDDFLAKLTERNSRDMKPGRGA